MTGYGRRHLANIENLGLTLAGVCDPLPVDVTPAYQDLDALLAETKPDITIIATPIHTHAAIAETVLRAGSAVLLEKPPVTSTEDLDRLLAVAAETGLPVEVGFQALGSGAVRRARELVTDGSWGTVRAISASGAWQRSSAYYGRAAWAGRRTLNGVPVVDGALTNPFAHALQNSLWLAGVADRVPESVELELFRANDIECDDTFCVRVAFPDAPAVMVAGTLCSPVNVPASVLVHGDRVVELAYEVDTLDGERFERLDQLANLAAGGSPLCPLETVRGFTAVVEAVRDAPDPTPIAPEHWHETHEPDGVRRVVAGVDGVVRRAASELRTFAEQGISWKGTL
ncbi:Gfo/Idh/MocA family oxidoreductase [Kibdelosporangium lantanae]